MILFVSRAPVSREDNAWVSQEVSQETGMELRLAASLEQALQQLRGTACRVAVVDAALLETDPKGVEQLLSESPLALPIFPNLAVCSPTRIVCEIKAAVRRGENESQRATEYASRELRCHLKNIVTAFLLNCDLALQLPDLPSEAGKKILLLHDLVTKMRDQLEIDLHQAASA
jgi:hypothetical protein